MNNFSDIINTSAPLFLNEDFKAAGKQKNLEKADFQAHEFIFKNHRKTTCDLSENKSFSSFLATSKKASPKLHKMLSQISDAEEVSFHYQQAIPIPVPTFAALKAHAQRYAEKYDISIKIVPGISGKDEMTCSVFSKYLQKELEDNIPRTIGIVFDCDGQDGDGTESHVVPVILQIGPSATKALVLDVLGLEGTNSTLIVKSTLKNCKIPYRCCSQIRQYDLYSCRTGALVTLRNALIDLKTRQDSPLTFLNKLPFSIPPQWGFTDQIFRPEIERESLKKLLNPRQALKTNQEKKQQSIVESRKRYLQTLTFHCELDMPDTITRNIKWDKILLPQNAQIKFTSEGSMALVWSETKKCNTYMLHKGYKWAGKIESLHF